MSIIEQVHNIKSYSDICIFINTNPYYSDKDCYTHPLFLLKKDDIYNLYGKIKNPQDFNEFNMVYDEYLLNRGSSIQIFHQFIEYANMYLLINNIIDDYKYAAINNHRLYVCYNNYVVIIYSMSVSYPEITFDLIEINHDMSFANIRMRSDKYIDDKSFIQQCREYKLKFIESL